MSPRLVVLHLGANTCHPDKLCCICVQIHVAQTSCIVFACKFLSPILVVLYLGANICHPD